MEKISLYIAIGIILVLIGIIFWLLFRGKKRDTDQFEEMEGHEFEYYCADLLKNKGFLEVEVTKGSGDYGVDILAEKDGITYAIQCKRYQGPVGVEAVLRTYGGRDYYERMVGVVMTNRYFTAPAVEAAKKLHILLWDRGYLDSMLEEE